MEINQTQLATALGVSNAVVSRLLSGKRPISIDLANRLAEIFPDKTAGFFIDADLAEIVRLLEQWEPRPPMR